MYVCVCVCLHLGGEDVRLIRLSLSSIWLRYFVALMMRRRISGSVNNLILRILHVLIALISRIVLLLWELVVIIMVSLLYELWLWLFLHLLLLLLLRLLHSTVFRYLTTKQSCLSLLF